MPVCILCVPGACRVQKKVLHSLKLKLLNWLVYRVSSRTDRAIQRKLGKSKNESVIPALRRQKLSDLCELEASLSEF